MVPTHHTKPARQRVAFAHDWLVSLRGGEHVLERLIDASSKKYEPAGIYTLFHRKHTMLPKTAALPIRKSPLNAMPARRWLLPMYPWAVDRLSDKLARDHANHAIDLLVSTSSGLIKSIEAPDNVPHLCYCHSPARYLWHAIGDYSTGSGAGAALRRFGLARFGDKLRKYDRDTVRHVDAFVANSKHTARQIETAFGRDARVVHPPVRTDRFTVDPKVDREDFWLVVSALEPYKRVDLAIEAAMTAGNRLMIAGVGSQLASLKKLVKQTDRRFKSVGLGGGRSSFIQFLGRVPDEQLIGLYRRARCLIFPQVEDFGIVALEAQACGCPVVARRAGGAVETVLEGRTGSFFADPTEEAIRQAVDRCPSDVAEQCRNNAEKYSEARFDDAMLRIMDDMLRR
ncbi:MAG: hypothetical protein CMJ31_06785 [Phycisphaerae bacterium]|nr:hypothetical protein [Phycisphaerae bacterium]